MTHAGLIERRDCQFHWFNRGYDSFEDFLATFTAEKRKKAKRERRRVAEAGIEFDTRLGGEMDDSLWRTVYEFYADTFYRHGHEPYLNLQFFKLIGERLPERVMLKIARQGRTPIARRDLLRGRGCAVRPLLGRRRQLPQPAFRDLLLPGDRILHREGIASGSSPARKASTRCPAASCRPSTSSAHYITDERFAAAIRDSRRARRAASTITLPPSTSTCPTTGRRTRSCSL